MSKNFSYLTGRKEGIENLFDRLGNQIEQAGSLSNEDIEKIAEDFLVGSSQVFGAASFYDFTRASNEGKKIYICNGSACLCAGTQEDLKYALEQHFDASEIGEMCCLGRCHENNAFHFNGNNYSGKAIDQITQIKNGKTKIRDTYKIKASGKTILTGEKTKLGRIEGKTSNGIEQLPRYLAGGIRSFRFAGKGWCRISNVDQTGFLLKSDIRSKIHSMQCG